jgi:hypothetical protein
MMFLSALMKAIFLYEETPRLSQKIYNLGLSDITLELTDPEYDYGFAKSISLKLL